MRTGGLLTFLLLCAAPLQGIEGDLLLAVQECLSVMAMVYQGITGEPAIIVEALMLANTNIVHQRERERER